MIIDSEDEDDSYEFKINLEEFEDNWIPEYFIRCEYVKMSSLDLVYKTEAESFKKLHSDYKKKKEILVGSIEEMRKELLGE